MSRIQLGRIYEWRPTAERGPLLVRALRLCPGHATDVVRVRRIDDDIKDTGHAVFAADLRLPVDE